jgi:enterochelin esterase-like enzyme
VGRFLFHRHLFKLMFLALAGMILLVTACSATPGAPPAAVPPPTRLPPTGIAVSIDATATPRPLPPATPLAIATATATATATAIPSQTPTATITATPTPAPCPEPGRVVSGHYPSQLSGPEKVYRIYLPPCYGEDGRLYPTLYMFHGSVSTDTQWEELGLFAAAETGILEERYAPLLIVLPDGGYVAQHTSGGPRSFEGVVLTELIPYIETTYCAWPAAAGRALGGLSRGGYWALAIAFRHAEQFASVGGHSAALVDIAAGPDVNPQYTGISRDLGNLRVYLDIGAHDYFIPQIRRLHEDMERAGVPHTWVLNEGIHEDAYWAAHLDEYLDWYSEPWPRRREEYPACSP